MTTCPFEFFDLVVGQHLVIRSSIVPLEDDVGRSIKKCDVSATVSSQRWLRHVVWTQRALVDAMAPQLT